MLLAPAYAPIRGFLTHKFRIDLKAQHATKEDNARHKPTTVLTHKKGRNMGIIARVPDKVRKPHLLTTESEK
jgi:hypothetical protein